MRDFSTRSIYLLRASYVCTHAIVLFSRCCRLQSSVDTETNIRIYEWSETKMEDLFLDCETAVAVQRKFVESLHDLDARWRGSEEEVQVVVDVVPHCSAYCMSSSRR